MPVHNGGHHGGGRQLRRIPDRAKCFARFAVVDCSAVEKGRGVQLAHLAACYSMVPAEAGACSGSGSCAPARTSAGLLTLSLHPGGSWHACHYSADAVRQLQQRQFPDYVAAVRQVRTLGWTHPRIARCVGLPPPRRQPCFARPCVRRSVRQRAVAAACCHLTRRSMLPPDSAPRALAIAGRLLGGSKAADRQGTAHLAGG